MCYDIPFVVGFCLSFCILFMSCISYHVIMCIAFAYVFVSCIRTFSPLSVLQSGAPISSGAPLLFSFVSGCQTFSEWTEACQVALVSYSSNSKVLKYSRSLTFVWVIIRFAFVKIFPRQHSEQALVLMNILSCLSALSMLLQFSLG